MAQAQQAQQAMAQQQGDMQQKMFVLDAAEKAARIRKLNAEAEAKLGNGYVHG
jgi:hypothetical protein